MIKLYDRGENVGVNSVAKKQISIFLSLFFALIILISCKSTIETRVGFIDKEGNLVIPAEFDHTNDFSEGFAAVESENKWGYIDKSGEFTIKPIYRHASSFHEGFAAIPAIEETNVILGSEKIGRTYIDKKGDYLYAPVFEIANDFSGGFACVKYLKSLGGKPVDGGGKWGFVSKWGLNGREKDIKTFYKLARDFSEGLAGVKIGRMWGFIDDTGKIIIRPKFYLVSNFNEGLAAVALKKN